MWYFKWSWQLLFEFGYIMYCKFEEKWLKGCFDDWSLLFNCFVFKNYNIFYGW